MIRYEIFTQKSGTILDATHIAKIVTTPSRKRPSVIVFVEKKNQKDFEKYIEGVKDVISYSAEPKAPGEAERTWTRP